MPFHAYARRSAAFAFFAFALWFIPSAIRETSPGPAPTSPPPPTSPGFAKAPALSSSPAAPPPPADSVFTLSAGNGSARPYAVALDELYFPSRPATERVGPIAPQPSLAALLVHVASLSPGPSSDPAPRLVLYPVGALRNAASRRIVNPVVDVKLDSPSSPTPAPRADLGIVAWSRPAYAPEHAFAHIAGDPAQPLRAAAALGLSSGIRSARPLLARLHAKKFIPNDPYFKDQWHLRNTGQQSGRAGIDIRAVAAWDTATGAGVVIGVVDDGVQGSHPDLAPAFSSLGYDFNDRDADASPVHSGDFGDDHGTAVAGLAAARGNNALGVSGSAPAATLASLRLLGAEVDDSVDAEAMAWRNDAIAIKNNSWGPPDASILDGIAPDLYPAQPLWRAAVIDAVTRGRDGLGTLFAWSSGNGQGDGDQGAKDGYSGLRYVLPVAAVTNKGAPSPFSEGGPHLVVAAPGSAGIGLATTDRTGDSGYNSVDYGYPGDYLYAIDYTRAFVGTSAAAPVAAGAFAVLLEAFPELGWRDVKELLLRSSNKLQPTSRDWTTRPAGDSRHPVKHHPRLGGGLLDLTAALTLARTWQPLAPEVSVTAPLSLALPALIPEATRARPELVASFTVPSDSPLLRVEHLELTLDITHPYRGDLEIFLTSPEGVVSTFATATAGDPGADYKNADASGGYVFSSVRHWGEPSRIPAKPSATWTLTIRDTSSAGSDIGTLHAAKLTLHGTPLSVPAVLAPLTNQALANGSTLVLKPGFSGGNLDYQWTRDGKPIPGATDPEYRLVNFTSKAAGAYACVATNVLGSTSAPALVSSDNSARETLFQGRPGSDIVFAFEPRPADARLAGLPPGLVYDRSMGIIRGRPTRAGLYLTVLTYLSPDGTVTKLPVNIDILPIGTTGTSPYQGIINRDPGLNADLGGHLTVTLNGDSGRATGLLRLGATQLPFSGIFAGPLDLPPVLSVTLPRAKNSALTLSLSAEGDTVCGTVTDGTHTAEVCAARIPWNKQTPFQSAARDAYTFFLSPDPRESLTVPTGHSIGWLQTTREGLANWRLFTADGTPALTGSGYVQNDGSLSLFALSSAPLGSVLGTLRPGSPSSLATLDWRRSAPNASGLQSYPGGIPLHALTPHSDRLPSRSAGTNLFGHTGPPHDLLVELYPPASVTPITMPDDLQLSSNNRFNFAPGSSAKAALVYDAATGALSGSLTLPGQATTPLRIQAVYSPGQNALVGHAVFPAESGHGPAPASGRLEIYDEGAP